MPEPSFRSEKFSRLPAESLTELYRNKRMELPFDPKSLVVFLDREHGAVNLRVLPYHHRSADTGTTDVIRERRKVAEHVYSQIDLKGVGFLFPESHESKKDSIRKGMLAGYPEAFLIPGSSEEPWGYNSLGLMDERMAMATMKTAEELSEAGLRVEGIAAIYRLAEIRIEGEPTSVADFKTSTAREWRRQARKMGSTKAEEYRTMAKDVEEKFDPVVMVRAMRSVFRLRDLRDAVDEEEARLMIEEACGNLNTEMRERGQPERFDASSGKGRGEWLKFISSWHARNAGLLHARGRSHLFLHMGNLSLAGEVVDLDSIAPYVKQKTFRGEPGEKESWLNKFRKDPLFHETENGCVVSAIPLMREPDPRFGLPKPIIKDIRDLCFSMRQVLKGPMKTMFSDRVNTTALAEAMTNAYADALGGGSSCAEWGLDTERLKAVFAEIASEVVGQGEYYAPIELEEEK